MTCRSSTLKGLALFLLLLLCNCFAHAQEETLQPKKEETPQPKKQEFFEFKKWDDNIVYSATDTPAQFEGGMKAFAAYVRENFKVPRDVEGPGKILVSFIIDLDGSIVDIKFLRDAGHESRKEMTRVLKASAPKWKPGLKDGLPARTALTLPINF